MTAIRTTMALTAFSLSAAALAQQADHRLGSHPAVIVKRLQAQQSYDYAAQFYPHPAWLYLQAQAPREMMDHPAVIVAQRRQQDTATNVSADRIEQATGASRLVRAGTGR
jgi:hypothetical protein